VEKSGQGGQHRRRHKHNKTIKKTKNTKTNKPNKPNNKKNKAAARAAGTAPQIGVEAPDLPERITTVYQSLHDGKFVFDEEMQCNDVLDG
jgi:hypothetical protein